MKYNVEDFDSLTYENQRFYGCLFLSISYKIIKAHGGDITAESNGKAYTMFTVTLPSAESADEGGESND